MPDKTTQTDHDKSKGAPNPSESAAPSQIKGGEEGTACVPDGPLMKPSFGEQAANDTPRRPHHDHFKNVIARVDKVLGLGKDEKTGK